MVEFIFNAIHIIIGRVSMQVGLNSKTNIQGKRSFHKFIDIQSIRRPAATEQFALLKNVIDFHALQILVLKKKKKIYLGNLFTQVNFNVNIGRWKHEENKISEIY